MSLLVHVRGLPWGAGEEEVRAFFQPLELAEESPVTLVNGTLGKPTGEAFVRFAQEKHATAALRYHKASMGKRYIEVFEASDQDLQISISRQGVRDFSDGVLRCRGLPFHCSAAEIVDFFAQHGVTEDDVTFGVHVAGRFVGNPNGEAWVRFGDEAKARQALQEKHLKTMGSRYIELYLSSKSEHQSAQSMPGYGENGDYSGRDYQNFGYGQRKQHNNGYMVENGASWLKARGLPYATSAAEVAHFFSGFDVEVHDVVIAQGPDARPIGEAFIRFNSHKQARAAQQSLHLHSIGNRYIELFHCNAMDVGQMLQDRPPFRYNEFDDGTYRAFGDVGFPYPGPWGYGSALYVAGGVYPTGMPYLPAEGALPELSAWYLSAAGNHPGAALVYPSPLGPAGYATWAGAQMPAMPPPHLWHPHLAAQGYMEDASPGMNGGFEEGHFEEQSPGRGGTSEEGSPIRGDDNG